MLSTKSQEITVIRYGISTLEGRGAVAFKCLRETTFTWKLEPNKDIFRLKNAERINHKQTYTTGNGKASPSHRRKNDSSWNV